MKEDILKNYKIERDALHIVEELFDLYGENFTHHFLYGNQTIHTKELVEEIKKELEQNYLITVRTPRELKLDKLIPNKELLIPDDNKIIDLFVKNGWICEEKLSFRTLFFKGDRWENCPIALKEHFEELKRGQGS